MSFFEDLANTDYSALLARLSPRGKAWGRTVVNTGLRLFYDAAGEELARLHARLLDLIEESDPRTTDDMIDAWERNLNLPDVCDPSPPSSLADRREAVLARLIARGGSQPGILSDVIEAAGYAGTEIQLGTMFRGDEAAGGDRLYDDDDWAFVWFVWALVEPTQGWGRLQCLLDTIKPSAGIVNLIHGLEANEAPPGNDYAGLHCVEYDGAVEAALHTSADLEAPWRHASGAIAMWVKTSDASGAFQAWRDVGYGNRVIVQVNGGFLRGYVKKANVVTVDVTGTTAIDDGVWHLVGISWTWASGVQLYVDGAADAALAVCADTWPATPAMNKLWTADSSYAGKIAHAAVFDTLKDAAWWAQAFAEPSQHWGDAANDWQLGDGAGDAAGLILEDSAGGLDLTTTGMGPANIILDHP